LVPQSVVLPPTTRLSVKSIPLAIMVHIYVT